MNRKQNIALTALVAEYEALAGQGVTVFMEEKAYLQLIDYYEAEEMLDRALEVIDHALIHYPFSAEFLLRKSALLLHAHQDEAALACLDKAEALAPNQNEVLLLRAEILIYQERQELARSTLEALKSTADRFTMSDIFFLEALLHESEENYELMFYALKAALRENAGHQDALERLWLCVELSKKYEESVVLHESILEEDPYSYRAWYNLGHAKAYLGHYEEAIEAYEFAFVINEKYEFAYRDCAELCFELRAYRKALKCYLELLEHVEQDGDMLQNIGECYQHLGQQEKALRYFREALRLDPMNDEAFFHIGQSYASREEWIEALKAYKKAIRIDHAREEYHGAIADVYFRLSEWEKADQHYQHAISITMEESQYWIEYGQFLLAIGEEDRALEALEEAEEYAASPELSYCHIACLFAMGRRREACFRLTEALAEDFDDHEWLFRFRPELRSDADVINILSLYF